MFVVAIVIVFVVNSELLFSLAVAARRHPSGARAQHETLVRYVGGGSLDWMSLVWWLGQRCGCCFSLPFVLES